MSSDLKLEIFAFQFFQACWHETGNIQNCLTVSSMYPDEYHLDPENTEIYEESHYKAALAKGFLYSCVFHDELIKIRREFECSPSYILDCICNTCGRDGLLGDLTVFELLLASCAFVVELGYLSFYSVHYKDVISYAHLCWATYFDEYKEEFYGQGGWSQLKIVSLSYVLPYELVYDISERMLTTVDDRQVLVCNIVKDVYNYKTFKNYYDASCKTISKAWVRFHLQNFNKSEGSTITADLTKAEDMRDPKVVEKYSIELRRLCDPNCLDELIAFSCKGAQSVSSESCKQSTEEIYESLLKLNNLTLNATTSDSTSIFESKERENAPDLEEIDEKNKLITKDFSGVELSNDQTNKAIAIVSSRVKWSDEQTKSMISSLPRRNEKATHDTSEIESSLSTPCLKMLKTSCEEVFRNKTQSTSKQNPNKETKNEIDLERENPDVQSILRMILILGDPEGIAHLRSKLPNSDLHQRMKKSKKKSKKK